MRELDIKDLELVYGGKGGKEKVFQNVKDGFVGAYHGIVGYNSVTKDPTFIGNSAAAFAGSTTYIKTHSETKASMAGLAAGQAADGIRDSTKPDKSGNDYDNSKDGNGYGG